MTTDGRPCILQVGAINTVLLFPTGRAVVVSAGQEEVVRELVGAGADLNRKNDKGITPLFVPELLIVPRFFHVLCDSIDTTRHQSRELK
jgi:hypothetical protein